MKCTREINKKWEHPRVLHMHCVILDLKSQVFVTHCSPVYHSPGTENPWLHSRLLMITGWVENKSHCSFQASRLLWNSQRNWRSLERSDPPTTLIFHLFFLPRIFVMSVSSAKKKRPGLNTNVFVHEGILGWKKSSNTLSWVFRLLWNFELVLIYVQHHR